MIGHRVVSIVLLVMASSQVSELEESRPAVPHVLRGSKSTVAAIAISSDGAWLAAASHDHMVRIWDVQTFRLAKTFNGHRDEVYNVAFSPDGKLVASASYDGQLILWNFSTGRILRSIALPTWAASLAFSPDGRRLAVPLQGSELRILNVQTGMSDTTFTASTNSVAYSSDGKYIAWGRLNVVVRNAATGDTLKVFRGHRGTVESIDFSPNGAQLVTASRDYTARVWNVASGLQERVLEPEMPTRFRISGRPIRRYKLPLRAAKFSRDGRLIATVGAGEIVHVWEASTGKLVTELSGESPAFTDVAFFPSGRRVAASGVDGGIRVFDLP